METLLHRQGRIVTQAELLEAAWGLIEQDRGSYLRTYLNRIRHKLEPDPPRPRYFLTYPGLGYMFRTDFDRRSE